MITLLLILWILIILGFNVWDWFVTKDGGKPDYLIYFIARGMAAILHGTLMLICIEDSRTNYGQLDALQLLILWSPYIIFQVCSFWIVYEIVRNLWSGKALLYFDDSELDSGLIDAFFAKVGHTFHAFCKALALAVAIISAMVIYYRS